jgi:hypothetical protein
VTAEEAAYARASLLRPAFGAVLLAAVAGRGAWWHEDQRVTDEARRLLDEFGGSRQHEALLRAWRAPERVRLRLYELITRRSPAGQEPALLSAWPQAHAGAESTRAHEAADLVRTRLEGARDGRIATRLAARLAQAYAALAGRLTAEEAASEARAIRTRLEAERDGWSAARLAEAYAVLARRSAELHFPANSPGCDDAKRDAAREVLTLAGHPFVTDARPLLAALAVMSGQEFDSVASGVTWWRDTCGGDPKTLRPLPLAAAR